MDRNAKGEALIGQMFGPPSPETRPAFQEISEITTTRTGVTAVVK